MWTSGNPKLLLFSISGLLTTAFVNAQNASCLANHREFKTVNSTGQYQFTWNSSYASDDPWYVSAIVGSKGTEWNDSGDVDTEVYISVPGNVSNGTGICIYQYVNINATLESGGENSCSGVISSACIDHLNKALGDATNSCPNSDTASSSEAFEKACPMLTGGSHNLDFVDVANSTCAYTNIPDVQIPDNYNTFGTVQSLGAYDATGGDNATANETYDLLTRQTIPLVLLGHFVDAQSSMVQQRVEFVCMTANKTVEGSRVPEQRTPWESAGTSMSAKMVGWMAGVVTAVMLVL